MSWESRILPRGGIRYSTRRSEGAWIVSREAMEQIVMTLRVPDQVRREGLVSELLSELRERRAET